MWVFTRWGFMSVVRKQSDALLTVRSRARVDLVNIQKHYMPSMGAIRHTPDADYPYRARIEPADFEVGMARAALDVTYDNFKSEVARLRGMDIEKVYAQVWSVMARNEHILQGPARKGQHKGVGRQRKLPSET